MRHRIVLVLGLVLTPLAACKATPAIDQAGAGGGSGPASTSGMGSAPAASPAPAPVFEQTLNLGQLESVGFSVTTAATCCGGKDEDQGAPIRFFITADDPAARDGWLLLVGKDDVVKLAHLSDKDRYGDVVWTGPKATRAGGAVSGSVPVAELPGGKLRLWLGHTEPTLLDSKELLVKLDSGAVPYALLDTGREASKASLPDGVEPLSGDPKKERADASPPPPGQEAGSGDPDKTQTDAPPPPTGVEPGSGDPDKAPNDAPPPASGLKPRSGEPDAPLGADKPPPPGQEPKSGEFGAAPAAERPPPSGAAPKSGDPDAAPKDAAPPPAGKEPKTGDPAVDATGKPPEGTEGGKAD